MIAYRRFYRRVNGKAEAAESIIAYQVKPYAYYHGSSGRDRTQYVKRLWIDLWLIVLHFEWLTKELDDES